MRFFKQVNGWIIKEKRPDEVPNFVEEERKYTVFAPKGPPYYGSFLEDNLTLREAVEWCNENNDFADKGDI